MDVLKAWGYAQTIFDRGKLQIAYIKAEKDTRKHIVLYFEGQKVVPLGAFGQTKLYFELEKRPAGAFFVDKIRRPFGRVFISPSLPWGLARQFSSMKTVFFEKGVKSLGFFRLPWFGTVFARVL